MSDWGLMRAIAVGGLVAVGFLDERRVVVGSHSGLGVFDAATGAVLVRAPDPGCDYAWFEESPPGAVFTGDDGQRHHVRVAGLWGGTLPAMTDDGWACRIQDAARHRLGLTAPSSLSMTTRNPEPAASRESGRSSFMRRRPPFTLPSAPRPERARSSA